ncbi:hypothetical protein F4810DRAFT_643414 [Camillea tinctor]|nr:hypothetical protein F4810DRAFT_643414 [Camillea tinctor]
MRTWTPGACYFILFSFPHYNIISVRWWAADFSRYFAFLPILFLSLLFFYSYVNL